MSGYVYIPDGPQVDGPDLDDQGLMECPTCEGIGQLSCSTRGNSTPQTCSRCLGDGVVEVDA